MSIAIGREDQTEGPLVAYTDGSSRGNPGPGGWAVVFSRQGEVVDTFSGAEGVTKNNRMELRAVAEAVARAPSATEVEIVTDSANVIGWLTMGWKRRDPTIAAMCRAIDKAIAERTGRTTFRKVKGHDDDALNCLADRLCTAASRRDDIRSAQPAAPGSPS